VILIADEVVDDAKKSKNKFIMFKVDFEKLMILKGLWTMLKSDGQPVGGSGQKDMIFFCFFTARIIIRCSSTPILTALELGKKKRFFLF